LDAYTADAKRANFIHACMYDTGRGIRITAFSDDTYPFQMRDNPCLHHNQASFLSYELNLTLKWPIYIDTLTNYCFKQLRVC